MTTTLDEILEAMWNVHAASDPRDKRGILKRWKRMLEVREIKAVLVLKMGNGHWLVESESRPGEFHAVDRSEGDYNCTCEAADLGSNKNCRHVRDIKKLEAA